MLVVYDIETDGRDTMTAGCLWTCETDHYEFFRAGRAAAMVQRINSASVACGFNNGPFDNRILERMARRRITAFVFDLYAEIIQSLGSRQRGWSLEQIAAAMLPPNQRKTDDSALMPGLFRSGAFDEVCSHCLCDVRVTIALLKEIIRRGGVSTNGATSTRVNVSRLAALQRSMAC